MAEQLVDRLVDSLVDLKVFVMAVLMVWSLADQSVSRPVALMVY